MSSASQGQYQVINMFDWTGGVRDKRENPLAFPPNALLSGENVDLVDGGLKTRQGSSFHTGPANGFGASGADVEVVHLEQVRFPTSEASYLVAQVKNGPDNDLYVSTDHLPVSSGSGSWSQIYRLGSGAGVVSIAPLNDRAVITDGEKHPPLVFAGCMDPSGADWAVPKAVIVTFDDGANWHDVTADVCDKDPDTFANIGSLHPTSGWLAVCTDMSGVEGLYFDMESGNTQLGSLNVNGYCGSWGSGSGWADNTAGLSSTGTAVHSGGVFHGEYHVVNSVPGYWLKVTCGSGTSPNTLLRRVLFRAPCQRVQVIGEGQPDTPLGFLYRDVSESSTKDFTVEVSDNTYPSFARLNDGNLENPVGVQIADEVYIGYLTPFNAVELTVHNDYHNENIAAVSGRYWTGAGWSDLSGFTDGTQDPAGKTLGKKGTLSWTLPSDWKQNRPVSPEYPHGYWVMLKFSAALTAKTYISEARIWPVLQPLKKHKFALTVRDRMVLCNRPDAPDQIDISRALEEYGFAGADSASLRIGGQDVIVAAEQAFNQGFIAKTEDWYILNGYNPQTFSVERAEAAGQAPINSRVVVRAPHTEADLKNLMGLYYINQAGAWYFAGLKVYQLSQDVSWWDPSSTVPRLDLDNLHKACGVYWPARNWVIWAVPMITDGVAQSTNNRLIVYDLTLRTWLPPFTLSLASMATAYQYHPHAAGKLGQMGLYGGDYSGRILRLFGPEDTSDQGAAVNAWVETGWLHFNAPEFKKLIRILTMYGKTQGPAVTLKVYVDGDTNNGSTYTFDQLDELSGRLFAQEQKPHNVAGRFFKFRIEFSDVTDIFGFQIGASVVREWGTL
jgi:hypothetical protein